MDKKINEQDFADLQHLLPPMFAEIVRLIGLDIVKMLNFSYAS